MSAKRFTRTLGKVGALVLALVLLLSISLMGCSSPPATTTVTTVQTQSTTATSAVTQTSVATATSIVQPITLKFAPGGMPNDKALFGGLPQWKAEVEKRTQGRVKIDVYYGETLAKGKENIDALQSGLADVIFPAPHHQPGKLPLFTLGNVPGLTSDYWAKAMAWFELLTTENAFADEFGKYNGHIIGTAYYSPCGLLAPTKLDTLAQLKGLKISAQYPASDIVAKFGAAPLSITPAEQYEGMLRKTFDALAEPIAASVDFKHYEVAKNFTWFNFGDRDHALVINKTAFAKLTPGDQKVIDDLAPDYVKMAYASAMDGLVPTGMDIMKNNGVNFFSPSADDQAKCLAAADELAAKWITEMDGKGLPGTALMTKYKALIKKYESLSPYKK
jgi:TRAP-type C4-dicarboxylate transport system substrate-binding protein